MKKEKTKDENVAMRLTVIMTCPDVISRADLDNDFGGDAFEAAKVSTDDFGEVLGVYDNMTVISASVIGDAEQGENIEQRGIADSYADEIDDALMKSAQKIQLGTDRDYVANEVFETISKLIYKAIDEGIAAKERQKITD